MSKLWKYCCRLCGSSKQSPGDCLSLKLHSEIRQKITKYLSIKDLINPNFPEVICRTCHKMLFEFDIFALKCEKIQDMFHDTLSVQKINSCNSKGDVISAGKMTFDRSASEKITMFELDSVKIGEIEQNSPIETNGNTLISFNQEDGIDRSSDNDQEKEMFEDDPSSEKSLSYISDTERKPPCEKPTVKIRKKKKRITLVRKLKQNEKWKEKLKTKNGKNVLQEIRKSENEIIKLEPYSKEDIINEEISDINIDDVRLKKRPKPSSYLKYDCHICHEDCRNWHALCIHFRDIHNARAKVMCICGKFLASRVSIGRHCAKHGKADSFNCQLCGKRFPRASELEAHQVSHLPVEQRPFVCCKCARRFTSNQLLRHHERMHIPISQRMLHPCELCKTKFATKSGLAMHVRAVHERLRPFVCDQCGCAFTTKGILEEHQVRHSDARPHKCETCGKSFKTKQRLAIHADTHGNTVYQCPHCPVKLNSRRTLRMHLFVHDEVYRYQCSFCDKAFKRAKDLKNHHNLHTGRRPYSCPWCDRTFANGSNCRAHKRRMHPAELATEEAQNNGSDDTINAIDTTDNNSIDNDGHEKKPESAEEPKVIHTTVKRKAQFSSVVRPKFQIPPDVTEKDNRARDTKPCLRSLKVEPATEEVISADAKNDDPAVQNVADKYFHFQSGELSIIPIVEVATDDSKRLVQGSSDYPHEEGNGDETLNVPIIVSSFSKSPPRGCPFIRNSAHQNLFINSNSYFSRDDE